MTPVAALSLPRSGRMQDRVVVYGVTLAVVTFIDRVCISQAESAITRDLQLSTRQMGLVFAAFTWAYALFEVPTGWMADRFGVRRVLTRIVTWWSAFTALTGLTWNFLSLFVTRALFGAGEAGCFPNASRMFKTWLPSGQLVRAQGIMWLAARWGGALTPLLVMAVLQVVSWRVTFALFGAVGLVWAVLFHRGYRDAPVVHPLAGDHPETPFAALRSPTVWLLWVQYSCMCYGWYFYITWLPRYLREARHLDLQHGALLAMLPLFFGGIGAFLSGALARRLGRWLDNESHARRLLAAIGLLGAAALLLASVSIDDAGVAMLAIGLASFCNDLAVPIGWSACMDVGGRYAGTVTGSMNMAGNIAGGIAPIATAQILAVTGSWTPTFYVSAGLYVVGAICWLFIDPAGPAGGKPP